jgi:hypothetical protein
MLGRNPRAELNAAMELMTPADAAELNKVAWRLAAWNTAKYEARNQYGEKSEQFKRAEYHLKRVRHRIRQAKHNGGTMVDIDWLPDDKLAKIISLIPSAELH